MKKLQNYGVLEMNAKEIRETEGGGSWWSHAKKAYATLTDDLVGTLAVAICPGPCAIAIAISATIDVAKH